MKKFYPVVHIRSLPQTLANVELAKNAGADGVFLIDHFGHPPLFLIDRVVSDFQDEKFSIGINYLGSDNFTALRDAFNVGCKMLWSDNAGMDEDDYRESGLKLLNLQEETGLDFFGGVHFKYQQKPLKSIEESLHRAFDYVRYPTLSGVATGVAADINFIRMASHTWKKEQSNDSDPYTIGLAIASGISNDNVEMYLPYIDVFLVASSIIDPHLADERFDQLKLEQLCKKIKTYKS